MRAYADTLRDHAPMSSLTGSPHDAEVTKAREFLLRVMSGTPWSERAAFDKLAAIFGYAISWVLFVVLIAFVAAFSLLVIGVLAFDVGAFGCRDSCDRASAAWITDTSILTGLVGATTATACRLWWRAREIARLRSLSDIEFLRAYKRWRASRDAAEARARREADLDYLAQQTALWNRVYGSKE